MKTFQLLGIIGDPIAHSLSPAMHNAVLRKKGFPFFYMPFHVTPGRLKDFIRDVPLIPLKGFNVTIPHKETVLKRLSWVSPEAKAIGAVNTVVVSGKKLKGYNTDAAGYLQSLADDAGFIPRGKTALVLGAGGAARAVTFALASAGSKEIVIANRTASRARKLAADFARRFPRTNFRPHALAPTLWKAPLAGADLVVNTSSVGMNGTSFPGLTLKAAKKSAVVSDLVYRPRITPLLRSAKRRRLKIHTGEGMLLHQGAAAFELWTGKKPDLRVMKKALLQAMKRG